MKQLLAPLWVGTNNRKKRAEIERLLLPLGVHVRTPDELNQPYAPVEDQPDFVGNARVKASLLARLANGIALADDSGLCVDALDGRPGVLSARYGGAGLDDRGRMMRLLAELEHVPTGARAARFVCSLCICGPDGAVLAAIEEHCEGTLLREPTGDGGFGYDPIFVPVEFAGDPAHAFARLDAATKDRLSHRGKAMRAMATVLPRLLADGR